MSLPSCNPGVIPGVSGVSPIQKPLRVGDGILHSRTFRPMDSIGSARSHRLDDPGRVC